MAIHASVMVVDDDPRTRRILSEMLPAHGYYVIEAANGREALAWLDAVRPDAVVVDLDMRAVNRQEFLAAYRQHTTRIPTIVLTDSGPDDWESLDGATVFTKPFNADELLTELRRMTHANGVG